MQHGWWLVQDADMATRPVTTLLLVAGSTPTAVRVGISAQTLHTIGQHGTELALWQRPGWAGTDWLNALPADALPTARLTLEPHQARDAVHAICDACNTPPHPARDEFVADVAAHVAVFAKLTGSNTVRLRLDLVNHNACSRWHRDCVPLRLICTYRGPATQWVLPEWAHQVLARPDDDTLHAQAMTTGDVAMFKGCGWPGQPHDGGIVHRSPRISGSGLTRLVLVLDSPPNGR